MKLPNFKAMLNTAKFTIQKHSPEILMVAGAGLGIASTVVACKATLSLENIIDETKETIDKVHGVKNGDYPLKEGAEYTDDMYKKDIAKTYAACVGNLIRLYAPAVILGGLSIASFLTSHKIMRKRYLEVGAAYATTTKLFKEYRGRVADEVGDEKEQQIYAGTISKKVKSKVVDPETGKTKTVSEEVECQTEDTPLDDGLRVIFCHETSDEWDRDPEYCESMLRCRQKFLNERLKSEGVLTLNDVRAELGLKRVKSGFRYGWKYLPDGNPDGDNLIDFGIRKIYDEREDLPATPADEFGHVTNFILNFNCDGDVWEDWNKLIKE